jgi:hypothetical protein
MDKLAKNLVFAMLLTKYLRHAKLRSQDMLVHF